MKVEITTMNLFIGVVALVKYLVIIRVLGSDVVIFLTINDI